LELGGSGVDVGCDDDNASVDGSGIIGEARAGGDTGSDLEGEEAFTAAMIAIEEGDASERETLLPEPADGLEFGVGKILLVDGEGDG
jgi:hypothetical protein